MMNEKEKPKERLKKTVDVYRSLRYKPVLDLIERGKDDISIAIRTRIPVSIIQSIRANCQPEKGVRGKKAKLDRIDRGVQYQLSSIKRRMNNASR
jgi:hypothetical protein